MTSFIKSWLNIWYYWISQFESKSNIYDVDIKCRECGKDLYVDGDRK